MWENASSGNFMVAEGLEIGKYIREDAGFRMFAELQGRHNNGSVTHTCQHTSPHRLDVVARAVCNSRSTRQIARQ